jgi:hypothetical protein
METVVARIGADEVAKNATRFLISTRVAESLDAFRSKDQREDIPSRELLRECGKPPLLEKVDARE